MGQQHKNRGKVTPIDHQNKMTLADVDDAGVSAY